MGDITVSVICTAYNHEKYIRKCLEGFVQQKTDFAFEVVINDDASSDKTASIIHEFETKYPDIIKPLYQSENQYSKGVRISRDIIYPKCRGKYIAICEGDDYWTDFNKLQKQVDALEAHPDCSMCVCRVKRVSEDESQVMGYCPDFPLDEGVIKSDEFLNIVFREYAFHTSSYVIRGDLYRKYTEQVPEFVHVCPVGDETYLLYFGNAGNVYYCKDTMSSNRRGSIGGWNSRTWLDPVRRRNYHEGMAKTYKYFDEYTGGKYHTQCKQRSYMEEYYLAESSRDFMKLLISKDNLFFKQSLRMKTRILLGSLCNPLLKYYYLRISPKN